MQVTASELSWLTQELLMVITLAVVMTIFRAIVENALEAEVPW